MTARKFLIIIALIALIIWQLMFFLPHQVRFDRAVAEFNAAHEHHDLHAMERAQEKTEKALHNWSPGWSGDD